MLTLQSSKSRSVFLLMFKVKQDSLDDVILLTSLGVSFTEVQEGLKVKREISALCLPVGLPAALSSLLGVCSWLMPKLLREFITNYIKKVFLMCPLAGTMVSWYQPEGWGSSPDARRSDHPWVQCHSWGNFPLKMIFLMLVLLVEYIFLTIFYGLYFSQ